MMLAGFNPNQIKDIEGAREAILHLLNLIETLKSENDRLRDENQHLRDEVNRLKGEQGKPNIKAKQKRASKQTSTNYSSEQERRQPSERRKRRKNDEIKIDREQVLEVDPDILPDDAEFKGYEGVTVQDIIIKTDNVRFRKSTTRPRRTKPIWPSYHLAMQASSGRGSRLGQWSFPSR